MRRECCGILLGVLRADRYPAKAKAMQEIADRTFGQRDAKLPLDLAGQIDASPANHLVVGEVRAGADPLCHRRRLLRRQLRRRSRRPPVRQPRQSFGIIAMHPIAQRLPVHAAVRRRLLARGAVKHQRQCQHPACRRGILAARRRPPKSRRIQIQTDDRDRAHHRSPYLPQTGSNQTTSCLATLRKRPRVSPSRRWYKIIKKIAVPACRDPAFR